MRFKLFLAVLSVLLLVDAGFAIPTNKHAAAQQDNNQSAKYQDDCSPLDTAGRCSDKCPSSTDTLLGFDKDTGAAICKTAPTGCPYGDSIPVDSPKCVAPVTPVEPEQVPVEGFVGK